MSLQSLALTAFTLLLCTTAQASDACRTGTVHADAPPETAQFAFMVGDHEVTLHAWNGESWTPPRPLNARWHGWYGLDGMAIYDEWIDPDPNSGGRGVNVRLYDPEEAAWKMMWISTAGRQVQELRAEMRDGLLTMWQIHPERPGWKAVFEQLSEEKWARVSYQQDETGDWLPQFRLEATRRPCR